MEEPWHSTWWMYGNTDEREYAEELFERFQRLQEEMDFVRDEHKRLRSRLQMRRTRRDASYLPDRAR